MSNLLCISDLHAPYHHPAAIDFLADLNRRHRPKTIVCLGDEVDAYAFSQFPKDPQAPAAGAEVTLARRALRPLFRLFPQVRICESNHTQRPFKRAQQAGLPGNFLRGLRQVLDAPAGWRWAPHWIVNDVLFLHGDGLSGPHAAEKAVQRQRRSTVIGHVHAHAGICWSTNLWGSIFGMSCGCLIDDTSPAFAYTRTQAQRPTLGCGLILDGVPVFQPLLRA